MTKQTAPPTVTYVCVATPEEAQATFDEIVAFVTGATDEAWARLSAPQTTVQDTGTDRGRPRASKG